jgi:type IV pilus assembly protein PilC
MVLLLSGVLLLVLVFASPVGRYRDIVIPFTSYLGAVVRRNLPLGSSLSAFAGELSVWRSRPRAMLERIADDTDNGMSLADALDRHPRTFSKAYRALVRAGERGGNLAHVIERLGEIARLRGRTTRRVLSNLIYPATLLTILASISGIVIIVVVPQFEKMFSEIEVGGSLPPAMLLFLWIAENSMEWWFLIPLGVAALSVALASLRGRKPLVAMASWVGWHVWPLRRYERRRAVSQYALVAGRLMEAGLAEQEALEIAAVSSGNACMDRIALAASERAKEGAKLSEALAAADSRGELPPEFTWYVEVGEASGRLPKALVSASESAAERSRSALGNLVKLIMPVGVLACAFFVGLLGYAVFDTLVTLVTLMEAF